MLFLLPPFLKSFGKRLIRSPKLDFVDSALAATLTRKPSAEAPLAGAFAGLLFEGLVVVEAVKAFATLGKRLDFFFWRSHEGLEVDLLLPVGDRLLPVEIKLAATPLPRHGEPIEFFKKLAEGRAASQGLLLVCRVDRERVLPGGNLAVSWQDCPGRAAEMIRREKLPAPGR